MPKSYSLDSFNPTKKEDHENTLEKNQELLDKAIDEVVAKQLDIGVDVVTDGEMSREAYFLHFVRKIKGMDSDNLVHKKIRNGKILLILRGSPRISNCSLLALIFREFYQCFSNFRRYSLIKERSLQSVT